MLHARRVLVDKERGGGADINLYNRFRVNAYDVAIRNKDVKTIRGKCRRHMLLDALQGREDHSVKCVNALLALQGREDHPSKCRHIVGSPPERYGTVR